MKNNCRLQQLQLGPTPDRNYKCSINHHQNRRKIKLIINLGSKCCE